MQIKKDEIRQRLMNAACELFTSKGFVESTISEITSKAGVGKGTFYTYFRSKEELVEAIIDEGMEELLEDIHVSMNEATKSGSTTFRAFIRSNLEFFSNNQAILKFFNKEMASYSKLQQKIYQIRDRYMLEMRNILEKEIYSGFLRRDLEVNAATSLLYGMFCSSVLHGTTGSQGLSLEHLGESIVALFKNSGPNPALA